MPFARTLVCICLVASALAAWADEANFVLVHGAWHGGWAWQPVAQRLRSAGHRVTTPTLTGLGGGTDNGATTGHLPAACSGFAMERQRRILLYTLRGQSQPGVRDHGGQSQKQRSMALH